ncbi:MAG: oxidoreductase [Porticoccaceae bacterium]|nr:MAG: oxidoreductase [Porticoccaceae bacterium]
MDLKLKDRAVLITGAATGFGLEIARTLAEEGANIGLCARTAGDVESAVRELVGMGVKAHGEVVDITDSLALKRWVDNAAAALGGVDGIVINASAGASPITDEGWRRNFEVDMLATWHFVNLALPYLEKSPCGSIVALSSTAALEKFFGPTPFAAMKAALLNYMGNLAHELAPKGIRANTVSPGPIFVEGGAWDKVRQSAPEIYQSVEAAIPLGRMGTAREVATQVALLLSPLSGFTTGANVVIDGCYTQRIQY